MVSFHKEKKPLPKIAAEFKYLNLRGFMATQTRIFWFALKSFGKVFGAGIICFALHLSLFSSFFDFGNFVALSGAQF
jgi:hypothetical protein